MQPASHPVGREDSPPTPPASRSPRRRQARRRAFRWILGGLVLLALGLLVGGRAYRALERWQAENLLNQAEELARQQMYVEAVERLDSALRLNPASVRGLRTLAEIYSRFDLPNALPIWRRLLAEAGHLPSDVHSYIELALEVQRFDLAESELARLLSAPQVANETLIQATEFALRQGIPDRALDFARQLAEREPTNRLHQLRVARILLSLPNPERQSDGIQVLTNLSDFTPVERTEILRLLANAPALPVASVPNLVDRLAVPADASSEEYFLHANVRLRLNPGQREAITTEAVDRYRSGTPEYQADLCQWLNRIGAHQTVVDTFEFPYARRFPPILAAYLEALARAERWNDLEKATADGLPIEGWTLASLRAVAASKLHRQALADEQWRRAFDDVAYTPAKLRGLGDLALRLGATEQAVEAFQRLTRDRLHRVTGYRRLAQVYESRRDTERLRTTMREWSSLIPDDPMPENAFCYLSALTRRDVETAYPRAQKLLARQPNRLVYRTTLAFLELRRDQPRDALQLFQRGGFEPRDAGHQTRLVFALALDANGQSEAARDLVRNLDSDNLLPEERDLLRRLLRTTR